MTKGQDQTQSQSVVYEAETTLSSVVCHYFDDTHIKGSQQVLSLDPLAFRKVNLVLYRGTVTHVICPFLDGERCRSIGNHLRFPPDVDPSKLEPDADVSKYAPRCYMLPQSRPSGG